MIKMHSNFGALGTAGLSYSHLVISVPGPLEVEKLQSKWVRRGSMQLKMNALKTHGRKTARPRNISLMLSIKLFFFTSLLLNPKN